MVSCLLTDQDSVAALAQLEPLLSSQCHVPTSWIYEITSALKVACDRNRLSEVDVQAFLARLKVLMIDHHHCDGQALIEIARATDLNIYDAAYLALCLQEQLPLATLDLRKLEAARKLGIEVHV